MGVSVILKHMTGSREILLVEDEPLVRMLAADVLREAGFEVLEAEDAEAALALMESSGRIAALFSDINMPGPIDGFELARRFRARRPGVGIVLTSGRFGPSADGVRMDGALLLAKPYRLESIPDVICQVLD